jgi:hypothetical protein
LLKEESEDKVPEEMLLKKRLRTLKAKEFKLKNLHLDEFCTDFEK